MSSLNSPVLNICFSIVIWGIALFYSSKSYLSPILASHCIADLSYSKISENRLADYRWSRPLSNAICAFSPHATLFKSHVDSLISARSQAQLLLAKHPTDACAWTNFIATLTNTNVPSLSLCDISDLDKRTEHAFKVIYNKTATSREVLTGQIEVYNQELGSLVSQKHVSNVLRISGSARSLAVATIPCFLVLLLVLNIVLLRGTILISNTILGGYTAQSQLRLRDDSDQHYCMIKIEEVDEELEVARALLALDLDE